MITDGRYKARATGEVVLGESAKKGTPFIELYFEILEGENKGGQVRWTGYFADGSKKRTVQSLMYCGWSGEDLGEFTDGELHGLDENEVEIVVALEEYEATKEDGTAETRTSPRVQWVNRVGGYLNVENAMSKDKAASFGDKMRGLVLSMKKAAPADAGEFPYGANAPPSQLAAANQRKGW